MTATVTLSRLHAATPITGAPAAKVQTKAEAPAPTALAKADGVRASGAGKGSAQALAPLTVSRRAHVLIGGGIGAAAIGTAMVVSPAARGVVKAAAREALPALRMAGKVAIAGAVATLVTVGFLALVGDSLTKKASPSAAKQGHPTGPAAE